MKRIIYLSSFALFMVLIFGSGVYAQAPEKQDLQDRASIREYINKQKTELKAQEYPKGAVATMPDREPSFKAGMDEPPTYPKFISYPTSTQKPYLIPNEEDPKLAQQIHELRLQHWYFIFDQAAYKQKYGALPTNLPGGMTPATYAAEPPSGAFSSDLNRYYSENPEPTSNTNSLEE